MKKVATLLVFVLSIQVATPSFAQTNGPAQMQALQRCIDDVVNKSLSDENLKKLNFGNRKAVDKLAAAKALFAWSSGSKLDANGYRYHVKISELVQFFGGGLIGISVGSIATHPKIAVKYPVASTVTAVVALVFLGSALVSAFVDGGVVELVQKGSTYTGYVESIFSATTFEDFYLAIADEENEKANSIRRAAILGCQEIRQQIWHFIDNPDVFITDLEQMKRSWGPQIVVDSVVVDGIQTPIVRLPSVENGFFTNPRDSVRK